MPSCTNQVSWQNWKGLSLFSNLKVESTHWKFVNSAHSSDPSAPCSLFIDIDPWSKIPLDPPITLPCNLYALPSMEARTHAVYARSLWPNKNSTILKRICVFIVLHCQNWEQIHLKLRNLQHISVTHIDPLNSSWNLIVPTHFRTHLAC